MIESQGTVEDVLAAIDTVAPGSAGLDLRISPQIQRGGQPLPFDFAIAMILDRLLSHSLFPNGFTTDSDGWRTYHYRRE
jgi:hypothetical protein